MSNFAHVCFMLVSVSPGGAMPLGTGFALGGRLIATAMHAVSGHETSVHLVVPREVNNGYQDTTEAGFNVLPLTVKAADPIHDLAILELPVEAEATVSYRIAGTDSVAPGEPVVALGYPHLDTGRFVLVQQSGSVGARILMENQGVKSKYLVLNTLLRPGQSGGPVFSTITGDVVAVVLGPYVPEGPRARIVIGGIDQATVHQTAHAVSAEYLAAMMA